MIYCYHLFLISWMRSILLKEIKSVLLNLIRQQKVLFWHQQSFLTNYKLDSDSIFILLLAKKISLHIIICFPNTAFKNNRHTVAFVGEVYFRCKSDIIYEGLVSWDLYCLITKLMKLSYFFKFQICSRIQNERGRDGRFEKLFILKDRNSSHVNKEVFIDRAVYSRNRCFRLPLSSKARKTSILVPTGRFKCRLMVKY